MKKIKLGLIFSVLIMLTSCGRHETTVFEAKHQDVSRTESSDSIQNDETEKVSELPLNNDVIEKDMFDGYKTIEVDGGDLSGNREANVVVDIGFGDREYWAFTNEYGQLVKVIAKEITLQDDSNEPVTSKGRYYQDEAKVPGTESSEFDEGHVIADSLGGVSNAYNITPQNSTLNRHGDQAYMEKVIRDAGGCKDFVAIITYPSTDTQIPSFYEYTYTIEGRVIEDKFPNGDPDKANASLNSSASSGINAVSETGITGIQIISLDKVKEVIEIKNTSEVSVDLTGWSILSVKGAQRFTFSNFVLEAGEIVTVGDSSKNIVDFHWLEGKGVWNNKEHDPAELYDASGGLISRFE